MSPHVGVSSVRRMSGRNGDGKLSSMNSVSSDVDAAVQPKLIGVATNEDVERRVRFLQHRCQSPDLQERLRAATLLYTNNGGRFSVDVTGDGEPEAADASPLPRHKILRGDFRLRSEAFMLTYHSAHFSEATWPEFLAFLQGLLPRLGCRGWAACLEKGTNMGSEDRWHVHAYFFWTDGVGIDVPNTDMFVFSARRPRVDCRHAASSMVAARLAAWRKPVTT